MPLTWSQLIICEIILWRLLVKALEMSLWCMLRREMGLQFSSLKPSPGFFSKEG
jgi:hypothetical protein